MLYRQTVAHILQSCVAQPAAPHAIPHRRSCCCVAQPQCLAADGGTLGDMRVSNSERPRRGARTGSPWQASVASPAHQWLSRCADTASSEGCDILSRAPTPYIPSNPHHLQTHHTGAPSAPSAPATHLPRRARGGRAAMAASITASADGCPDPTSATTPLTPPHVAPAYVLLAPFLPNASKPLQPRPAAPRGRRSRPLVPVVCRFPHALR